MPPTVTDTDGDTLVHLAAGQNLLELLSFLISRGVDCNARNKSGSTPLHCAAERGCTVAATILLEAGATVDAVNANGKTAMSVAQSEAVRKVLAGVMARSQSGATAGAGAAAVSRTTPSPRGDSRGNSPHISDAALLNEYTQV